MAATKRPVSRTKYTPDPYSSGADGVYRNGAVGSRPVGEGGIASTEGAITNPNSAPKPGGAKVIDDPRIRANNRLWHSLYKENKKKEDARAKAEAAKEARSAHQHRGGKF